MGKGSKIDKSNIEEILSLSPMQEGMLFHYLTEPHSEQYFEQLSLRLLGEINMEIFEKAWEFVTYNNDMLRTLFRWDKLDKPIQLVLKKHDTAINSYDFACEEISVSIKKLDNIKLLDKKNKFDLEEVPFRVTLCKIEKCKYEMIITNHHILFDGWSTGIILQEFFNAYDSLNKNKAIEVQGKCKFKEFIKYINNKDKTSEKRFWKGYLQNFQVGSFIKNKTETISKRQIDQYDFQIKGDFIKLTENFIKDKNMTFAELIYSTWGLLLQKYTNSNDVVFGTTISGRNVKIKGIENTVGLFINTLPLRVKNNKDGNILKFLDDVKIAVREREIHETTSLVDIKEYSEINNKESLFDSLVVIENYPLDNLINDSKGDLTIESYSIQEQTNYPLTLSVSKSDELNLILTYDKELISEEYIKSMANHFINIFEFIIKKSMNSKKHLDILTESERNKILHEFNDTKRGYSAEKTMQELFEEQVEKTPNNIAVVYQDKELTYKQLNEKSNSLARKLKIKGVMADSIVGLMLERSAEMIIGIMAILKAGGAYLPLDPSYPKERIEYMLKDSESKIVLSSQDELDDIEFNGEIINLLKEDLFKGDSSNLEKIIKPSNLAYVIYTSGTTGIPKGVMVENRNLTAYVDAFLNEFKLSDKDIVLQQATYCFDGFVDEVYPILLRGGRFIICNKYDALDLRKLENIIFKYKISVVSCSPLFLNELNKCKNLSSIHTFISGGDILKKGYINNLINYAKVYNTYGPTETTVCASFYKCDDKGILNIPIGKPIKNYRTYILDKNKDLVPIGIPGELYISGDGVARGYLNRQAETNEKFVDNPFELGRKMYKTGDLVRWLPDGNIEFLGRIDNQVKIRGFRIELEEIENRLLQHEEIQEATVVIKENEAMGKYVCAYVVSQKEINRLNLRSYLKQSLPEYTIPSYFVQLEKMPLTNNGKLDKKALPEAKLDSSFNQYESPRNKVEEELALIWSEVLTVNNIGINDNFFDLGGHSLKATVLVSKIHKKLNVEIPLKELFETPTIKGISDFIKRSEENLYSSIKEVEEKEYYEVSSAQKRMYIMQKFEENSIAYNMPAIFELQGKIDSVRIENTFKKLIERHEVFRTSIKAIEGEIIQKIDNFYEFKIGLTKENEEVENLINKFIRPFELDKAPLLRVQIVQNNHKTYLLIDMHHIISDGVSMNILIKDFSALYNGENLESLKIQYKDFAEWQNKFLRSEEIKKQEEYWINKFNDEVPVLNLPYDYDRPVIQSFEGDSISFKADEKTTEKLRKFAKETGATMHMVLLSALNILLSKYSGQEDIVIGTPIAGRSHAQLQNIVGMFVNTLALRNKPEGNKKYLEFLKEVKENSLKAYENQSYQFEELVEKLNVGRHTSRNPLFDVMFNMLDVAEKMDISLNDLLLKQYTNENKISKFDLSFNALDKESVLEFSIDYCTDLFKKETILRLIDHYVRVLEIIADNQEIKIDEIELPSYEEKNQILYEFNDTRADFPSNKMINELFEEKAEKNPDNIAVVFEDTQLTYKELNDKANQLARLIRDKGVEGDSIVGLIMERTSNMIVAMLGVLKAGGAYLPIDPEYPEERISYMIEDSKIKLLITQKEFMDMVKFDGEVININDDKINEQDKGNLENITSINNLAYIIYTSGTTGKPKGVMIDNKNVIRLLFNEKFQFDFNEKDVWTMFHSYCFDFSVWEMYGALLYGGKLVVVPKEVARDSGKYLDLLKSENVTILNQIPTPFNNLLNNELKTNKNDLKLRYVIFGGEALNPKVLKPWRIKYPNTKFINMYGITETTVHVTYKDLKDEDISKTISNIGKPIPTLKVYIMDKNLKLQPIGIEGEMYVSGHGVARGYLNRPELTAERFVNDPFESGKKMYRTGDLARWLPNGDMEFLGRVDQQVKIRGFRIELGEIESTFLKNDYIKETIIIDREDGEGNKYLCAYIVSDKEVNSSELRKYLRNDLPEYMIPSYFVQLEKMPLTSNGKVDKKALPKPQGEINTGSEYEAARNEVEEKLVEIWEEVLGVDNISINDNFFDLGGHSLKATILISKIHKELNREIPLKQFFKTPTIKEISGFIEEMKENLYSKIKKVAEDRPYYEASSAQKRMYMLQQFNKDSIAYNMPVIFELKGEIDKEKLENIFKKLVRRHEGLRTYFETLDDAIVQRVNRTFEFNFVHRKDNSDIETIINKFIRSFELEQPELLRVELVENNGKIYLLIDMHHIISDGVSMSILIKEFIALYKGEILEPLKLQYKDFAEWQNHFLKSEEMKKQKEYWKNRFNDEIPVLNLPYDYKRPAVQSFEGDDVSIEVDKKTTEELKVLSKETGTTMHMVLLSAFNILLSKYSGQEDIVVGTPISGRTHADLQNIIGMFVNTLALRNKPEGDKKYLEFLNEVKENSLKAYENQSYQLENLIEELNIRRDISRNPLFDTMFIIEDMDRIDLEVKDFKLEPYKFEHNISKFDLVLAATENNEKILLNITYCKELFKKETIEKLSRHLINIINNIAFNKDIKLKEIDILNKEEKQQLLVEFNDTKVEYPKDKTIQELFEEQVEKTPDNIAVVYEDTQLTYRQLNEKANRIAKMLRQKGIVRDSIVGVILERTPKIIEAALGVLKAGGAYLPIDPTTPKSRVSSILVDSKASVVLTTEDVVDNYSFYELQDVGQDSMVEISKNCERTPIKDFDGLPIPDRTLVDYEKFSPYIGQAMVKNAISIQATRGCPYNCAYCHKIWHKKHFVRSAENIFKEIQLYYNIGVKRFAFIDDIFNLDIKNSREFFRMVVESQMKIQIFFPNGLRGDILTKDYIDLMVEAGTVNVAFALETASPRLQKLIGKNLNIEKLRENIEYITEKYPNVILELFTMHGFPTETEEEALMTLNFIKSIKWIHFPYVHILKIYPDTDMEKIAIENGVSEEDIQKSVGLAYHELPDTLPFDKSFTLKYQGEFLYKYFLSKDRLLKVLSMQMKVLTEDELVQKYNSYLPVDINSFEDLLEYADIDYNEFEKVEFLSNDYGYVPSFNQKLKEYFPEKQHEKGALRVLMLDLSQFFSSESSNMLYDVVEPPLGPMYLLTYLNNKFHGKIQGKIAKSRIDFDSFEELKALIQDFNPDVISIRTLTYYRDFFHKTVSVIRQWGINVPIIAGGPYGTSGYKSILKDTNVNMVILGEGEITFGEIVEKMLQNGNLLPEQEILKDIPGIAFVKEQEKKSDKVFNRDIILLDKMLEDTKYDDFDMVENINVPSDLAYVIYTSGTTGNPKGVMIEHRNVVRLFFNEKMQFDFCEDDVWTMFHSFCFDFSVWEMYGALLFGGSLIIVPKLIAQNPKEYLRLLKREKVTILNQTPTAFYALAKEETEIQEKEMNVRYVIFGGEALNPKMLYEWSQKYDETKLINMYGITETTVHVTYKEIEIQDIQRGISNIGKPIPTLTTYVMDKHLNIQPIGVPGELFVGGDGVARGYLNRELLTEKRFIMNPYIPNERVYKTGDLVKLLENGELEYLGRVDNQVKIRGFRIELGEIENRLVQHKNIKEAVAVVKENNDLGKYICAYVVSNRALNDLNLKRYLNESLPDYMIPSYFVLIERVPLTSNGKLDILALPEPNLDEMMKEYEAPRTNVEEKLSRIWSDILGVKKVGINDNFFELGGHSLKATVLISKIHEELNKEISLKELFKSPTIKGLSGLIGNVKQSTFSKIEKVEEKEYYKATSAQKRMYMLQQFDKDSIAYNMPIIFELEGNINKNKIEKIFKNLVARHEALRTYFETYKGEIVQKVNSDCEFNFAMREYNEDIENIITNFIRVFKLDSAPLIRVEIVKSKEKTYLLIDMHHIISDGVSVSILIKEFIDLYNGEELKPLKLQYKDFAEWQNKILKSEDMKKQEEYWIERFKGEIPVLNLPYDYRRPTIQSFEGDSVNFQVDEEITENLRKLAKETGTTMHMVILSAFNILLSKYSGQEDIVVGTPIAGRIHPELQNILGIFVNTLALRNMPKGNKKYLEFLYEVKDNSLKAYENQSYQFDELVEKLDIRRDTSRNPLYDVMFNMIDTVESEDIVLNDLLLKQYNSGDKISKFDLHLSSFDKKDKLEFSINYSLNLFKHESIESMVEHFKNILNQIGIDRNQKIENISMSSSAEIEFIHNILDDSEHEILFDLDF